MRFHTTVAHEGSSRRLLTGVLPLVLMAACSAPAEPPSVDTTPKPVDPQHLGITTPHGDHSPHRGGMVLMNGEVHFEVVLDPGGRHRLWFTDAIREDLPASIASDVLMIVTRQAASPERLALTIDESGESWVASGQPIAAGDVMVTVSYLLRREPYEIEIPFTIPPN